MSKRNVTFTDLVIGVDDNQAVAIYRKEEHKRKDEEQEAYPSDAVRRLNERIGEGSKPGNHLQERDQQPREHQFPLFLQRMANDAKGLLVNLSNSITDWILNRIRLRKMVGMQDTLEHESNFTCMTAQVQILSQESKTFFAFLFYGQRWANENFLLDRNTRRNKFVNVIAIDYIPCGFHWCKVSRRWPSWTSRSRT